MAKEFEYVCKTQNEFVQMVVEHKAGFKFCQDVDYEIHILYKNGAEFHLNAKTTEGAFSRTGIKVGIISTELEEIHFGNIAELESSVQKFNMVTFWESKSKNDPKAAVVFEFVSEMINKTKTGKYHSNDKIVRMLRGFKFNTNANFNLCMTLDLHYITEFSAEILFLFSEYMKNQCGYVVTPSQEEVTSMTNVNVNSASTTVSEKITENSESAAPAKSLELTAVTENITKSYDVVESREVKGYVNIMVKLKARQNTVAACNKIYSMIKKQYKFIVSVNNFADIKPNAPFIFGKSTVVFNDEKRTISFILHIDELTNGIPEKNKNNELTKMDILKLIEKIEIIDCQPIVSEKAAVEITAILSKTTVKIQPQQIYDAITYPYTAEDEEKRILTKLFKSLNAQTIARYIAEKQDKNFLFTHSNIDIRVYNPDRKFSVIKSMHIPIFAMVDINPDVLKRFHNALSNDITNGVLCNQCIIDLIDDIQKKIVTSDNKPVWIDNTKKGLFFRIIKRGTVKATHSTIAYNKSNVENFVSGYVLASYNNRLSEYLQTVKTVKK